MTFGMNKKSKNIYLKWCHGFLTESDKTNEVLCSKREREKDVNFHKYVLVGI